VTGGAGPGTVEITWPLFSADDHIDMWALPPDVWTARLPARLRDAGPHVESRDGVPTWVIGDRVLGISGQPTGGGQSALGRVGLDHDGLRCSDPVKRLSDMEGDGVSASVIYGPTVLGLPISDPDLEVACWRAWTDWTAEFNARAPGRLAALPVLPRHDPQAAATELVRAASLGHRGAQVMCWEIDLADPAWDPMWAAAQDTGLPISFHIGGGVRFPAERGTWRTLAYSAVVAMQMADPLVTVVFSGVLERHPGLRIVLAESGLGWVPYLVHRMDAVRERWAPDFPPAAAARPASELFGDQLFVTFEEEVGGAEYLGLLPPGSAMWASDYPHVDSTFPRSRQAVAETLAGLDPATWRVVTEETCRRLYRLG